MKPIDSNLSADTAAFCISANAFKDRLTVIVLGTPRGGTSAVAGLIHRMGIAMGDNLPNNYEDPDFRISNREKIPNVISERNENHSKWGFKCPNAVTYLPELVDSLVNPVLIVVDRDAVASLKRVMRRRDDPAMDVLISLLKRKVDNAKFVKSTSWPTLYVSYEKLINNRQSLIKEVAEFLGVDSDTLDLDALVNFLEPGSYK